jgi:hypothetical protein
MKKKKKKNKKKINEIKRLIHIHKETGLCYRNPYLLGLHNGMELVLAILLDRDPKFK